VKTNPWLVPWPPRRADPRSQTMAAPKGRSTISNHGRLK
jgi:hypothetical protein